MLSSRQSRRAQNLLILTGVILAIYYLFVFRNLDQRSAALDQPLKKAWQKLAAARISSDSEQELNITELERNLAEVENAVATVEEARQTVQTAVALDRTVRDKIQEPFQLVDFQIEQLLRIEELERSAQQNAVTLSPGVFSNFPEYQAESGEASLLWGQLTFLHHLLETAIRSKVSVVENIQLPSIISHSRNTNSAFAHEIPVRIELVGSMESISKLLAALPQRGSEAKDAEPVGTNSKPALFVDRIVLLKNSPERPEEAHLDLQVCGFIYGEEIVQK